MEKFRYLPGVTTLEYEETLCVGCGSCETVCPHGVFAMNGKKVRLVDKDGCMECGACALNCETEAITVRSGVGCASAVISESLGRTDSCCRAVDDSTTA